MFHLHPSRRLQPSVTLPPLLSSDCKCCARGTLNISLSASDSRRGLLVDLWFDDPSTWAFNLGDSKSNNGYKGDSGHSSYDAEIHNTNANSFIIYRNDQFNAVPAADKYHKVCALYLYTMWVELSVRCISILAHS